MIKSLNYEILADSHNLSVRFREETQGEAKKNWQLVGTYADIYQAIKGIIDFEYRRVLMADPEPDQDLSLRDAVTLYAAVKKRIMDQIEIPAQEQTEQIGS